MFRRTRRPGTRVMKPIRRSPLRRFAAEEEEKQPKKRDEGPQPGDVSQTLRRRMGDDIADMFIEAGRELYKETVESLKDVLKEQFGRSIPELDQALRAEGGKRWQRQAAEFYRPWINEMVESIVTQGMNEASVALEDVASDYAAEHAVIDEEGAEKEELLEVPVEETEEVDEVEGEEEVDEEEEAPAEEGEEEEVDLEALLAAKFPQKRTFSPKRRRSPVFASSYRKGLSRYDDDVLVSLAPLRELEKERQRQEEEYERHRRDRPSRLRMEQSGEIGRRRTTRSEGRRGIDPVAWGFIEEYEDEPTEYEESWYREEMTDEDRLEEIEFKIKERMPLTEEEEELYETYYGDVPEYRLAARDPDPRKWTPEERLEEFDESLRRLEERKRPARRGKNLPKKYYSSYSPTSTNRHVGIRELEPWEWRPA